MKLQARHQLTFYADLAQFIGDPTPVAFDRLLRVLDILAIALRVQPLQDFAVQIHSARRAMSAVVKRLERTGALAVSDLDAVTLRAAAPQIEAAIWRVQLDTFSFANAIVQHKLELQGVALTD
ncbi:hypothetical protein [Cupriavidus numazuensis]|uniref:MarR family transcriptional regulator n=1 Tax=Cupriavidus numazuensis TaxID=221992 RepID=A0ABN7PW86_9BURK|nr:hypothetical protein [Cupriavidus numazuensis]CAG2129314.1 hypothetical protein LMG26411_00154 [Cupriavidus numazuensis]